MGGRPWSPVSRSGERPVGSLPWSAQAHWGWPGEEGRSAARGLGTGAGLCRVSGLSPPSIWWGCLCTACAPQHVSLSWGARLSPGSACSSAPRLPPGSACHGPLLEASEGPQCPPRALRGRWRGCVRLAVAGPGVKTPVAAAPGGRGLLGSGRGVASAGTRAPGPRCHGAVPPLLFPEHLRGPGAGDCSRGAPPGRPFLLAVLPTSPRAAGLRPHLLPLGPTTAPPGVGTARVAAGLATTSCSFPCPSPALACSVWPAEPRITVPVPLWQNSFGVASASLDVSLFSLQGAGQRVAEVAMTMAMMVMGTMVMAVMVVVMRMVTIVMASTCRLLRAHWMLVQTLPHAELCSGEPFSWSDPPGLDGACPRVGPCRACASALEPGAGGDRSAPAWWLGVSWLGPGGRGV